MKLSLSIQAMATRFEMVLLGEDEVGLRAAGEEALREIERVEEQLSRYRQESEIATLNRLAAHRPVRVSPPLFRLLEDCRRFTAATAGAFDVTIGPFMRAWRFTDGRGGFPSPQDLATARAVTGIDHLIFDPDTFTIAFDCPGVEIDLGGYGKGYAIERAIEILREYRVRSALLHGGTSSVAVIGPDTRGPATWSIRLQSPLSPEPVNLHDEALSVSAVHGRSFRVGEREYGHVINPATGEPVVDTLAAAAIGPSAAVCEVISTALLVRGVGWLPEAQLRFPGYRMLLAHRDPQGAIVNTQI
jgi:FAD:protein FMN transferase